jgi:hypothetical protein
VTASALVERPAALFPDPPRKLGSAGVRRPTESSGGGRLTLEQRLDSVWEGLAADGAAECPMCRGSITRSSGAPGGRCGDCGTAVH